MNNNKRDPEVRNLKKELNNNAGQWWWTIWGRAINARAICLASSIKRPVNQFNVVRDALMRCFNLRLWPFWNPESAGFKAALKIQILHWNSRGLNRDTNWEFRWPLAINWKLVAARTFGPFEERRPRHFLPLNSFLTMVNWNFGNSTYKIIFKRTEQRRWRLSILRRGHFNDVLTVGSSKFPGLPNFSGQRWTQPAS